MKLTTALDVRRLWSSATAAAALGASIETGLLRRLAEKPMDAHEIVRELGIPGKRGYYWLQVLETTGILEITPEGYAPSDITREAILESWNEASWKHLVEDERERVEGISNLALYLRQAGSIWAAQGLPPREYYVDKLRKDPTRARDFARMLFEVHQLLARNVCERLDLSGVQSLMDVGGGSGVISMALLRKYPGLSVTVVDLENTCIAGREIAREQGLSHRITYQPVEFFRDDFPTGFDAILKCDVSVFDLRLFKKMWNSLRPGGRVFFVEHLSPDEYSAPLTNVEWVFHDSLADPDYSTPTSEQVASMLTEVGFKVLPETQTFGTGWVLFQADKPA